MTWAAAWGFCVEAVARAIAKVAAKGDRASGLPAAAHTQTFEANLRPDPVPWYDESG